MSKKTIWICAACVCLTVLIGIIVLVSVSKCGGKNDPVKDLPSSAAPIPKPTQSTEPEQQDEPDSTASAVTDTPEPQEEPDSTEPAVTDTPEPQNEHDPTTPSNTKVPSTESDPTDGLEELPVPITTPDKTEPPTETAGPETTPKPEETEKPTEKPSGQPEESEEPDPTPDDSPIVLPELP